MQIDNEPLGKKSSIWENGAEIINENKDAFRMYCLMFKKYVIDNGVMLDCEHGRETYGNIFTLREYTHDSCWLYHPSYYVPYTFSPQYLSTAI